MKYKQEVKDKAVKMAKEGKHLKAIQQEIGPNPKAIMRYLAKEGVNYKDLLAGFKKAGKTPVTPNKEGTDKAEKIKAANKGK